MKRQEIRSKMRFSTTAILVVIALLFVVAPLGADEKPIGKDAVMEENVITATLDGINLAKRRIYIGDAIFLVDINAEVKGTPSKLGLLSDLKKGEKIRFFFRENDGKSRMPIIHYIERF